MEASPSPYNETEQKQPTPTPPPQPAGPDMQHILSLLPHMPIEQLAEDRLFAVAYMDRLDDDIFVVFHNWVTDEFHVFKLAQRHRQPFIFFLQAIHEQNVQDVYIENIGTTFNGDPYFRAFGGGFNLYLL